MNIFSYLNQKYSQEKSEDWDPVGFSFHFRDSAKQVLICLDLTKEALDFAINNKIDTVLTHHPFIFAQTLTEEFKQAPYKKQMIKKIKQHQINIFSLHTNFDSHKNGTAYNILKSMKLNKAKHRQIDKYNILVNKEISVGSFLKSLENLNLANFNANVDLNKILHHKIASFAILPGSGGIEAVIAAKKQKADLIMTSDLKWNEWLVINSFGKKSPIILEVSHLIESVFINAITKDLTRNFSEIKTYAYYEKELKLAYQIKEARND